MRMAAGLNEGFKMKTSWIGLMMAVGMGIAGCATVPEAPPQKVRYNCDDGRSFSLSVAASGRAAWIEIKGMKFDLEQASKAGQSGERFTCDMLTVTREGPQGENASVEMDGQPAFRNCVRIP